MVSTFRLSLSTGRKTIVFFKEACNTRVAGLPVTSHDITDLVIWMSCRPICICKLRTPRTPVLGCHQMISNPLRNLMHCHLFLGGFSIILVQMNNGDYHNYQIIKLSLSYSCCQSLKVKGVYLPNIFYSILGPYYIWFYVRIWLTLTHESPRERWHGPLGHDIISVIAYSNVYSNPVPNNTHLSTASKSLSIVPQVNIVVPSMWVHTCIFA